MIVLLDLYVDCIFMERVCIECADDVARIAKEWAVLGDVSLAVIPRRFGSYVDPLPYGVARIIRHYLCTSR